MKGLRVRLKERLQSLVSRMLDAAMEEQKIFERYEELQKREKELLDVVDTLQRRIEVLEERQARTGAFGGVKEA